MSETRPTPEISLSALRPELFRLVPKLRETGEVLLLTHHRKVVAVLGPPYLLKTCRACERGPEEGGDISPCVVIRIRRDERQLPALLKLFLGVSHRKASADDFPEGTLALVAELHDQLDWFVEESTS